MVSDLFSYVVRSLVKKIPISSFCGVTEFPSIQRLLIKKIRISGNNPQIQKWWYEVMPIRPPPLPKNEERYREEILDRIEEGW